MDKNFPLAEVLYYAKNNLPKDKVDRFKPHYVYMIATESGELLYIGMASCMKKRMAEHKRAGIVWREGCRVFSFETRTRRQALDYEAMAIKALKPKLNKMHNNGGADCATT